MDHHLSPPAGSPRTEADIIDVARSLIPQVLAQRDACDSLRCVSTPMVEALAEAGLLQMYLPRAMGGPELPPLVVFRAVEEISRADGSIGWCTMLSTAISSFTAWFDADVGRAMAGCPADLRLAGSIRPQGRARPVDGGYRIDGHWDFASGVTHARWLLSPCVIWDGNKPMLTPAGTPKVRSFFVPSESITIQDTWRVLGLRGTGSHDFTIRDVFVPERHSFHTDETPKQKGALYDPRLQLTWVWTATVANAMGIARGALEAFVDLAARKASTTSTTLLRDRPLVQTRIAEAEAILSAARAYLHTAVGDLWARASRAETDLDAAVVQARLAITHGMHETVRCVDLIFHAAGTNAVYERSPLERHFRDIHVAVQHAAGLPVHMEAAGKVLLGLRPTDPGW
jgi:alkylation response protein AidB-like acyl-CoA dehydrogenase